MDEKTNHSRHWLVFSGACLVMIVGALGSTALSFFVTPVTEEFGYTRSAFTLYVSLIAFVGIFTMPVLGRLIGRVGARKLVLLEGILVTLGFIGLSYSTPLISFYLWGAIMGLLLPVNLLAPIILINTWFLEKKGMLIGIAMSFSGVGGLFISMIMPGFIAAQGWRAGYLLLAVGAALFTMPVALLLIRDNPQSVGLKPYGYKESDATAAAGQGGSEGAQALPGVPYGKALKSPAFFVLYLGILLLSIIMGSVQHLPAHFTGQGFSSAQVAGLMSMFMLSMIAAKILIGILDDKVGTVVNLILCYSLFLISCILLAVSSAYTFIAVAMVLFSVGFATISIFSAIVTSKAFGPRDYSGIYGIIGTALAVGVTIGTPLWGMVYDKIGTYNLAFYISVALIPVICLSLLFALKSGKKLQEIYKVSVK